jgi:hypothetical protein
MRWVQTAGEPSKEQTLFHLKKIRRPAAFGCNAWLAGQLSEPIHMTASIGMGFQSYLEIAQLLALRSKGRRMLHEVAEAFSLDPMRGLQL